jgi:hypothetical protein
MLYSFEDAVNRDQPEFAGGNFFSSFTRINSARSVPVVDGDGGADWMQNPESAAQARPPASFISTVYIHHGPRDAVGRYFLEINGALVDRGINLEFGSFDELLNVNEENKSTWPPLVSTFNPRLNDLTESNSFCLLGRDAQGKVVATQAGRLFDWRASSFTEAAESMHLFYKNQTQSAYENESWRVTAPMGKDLRGMIAFTGAVWYHPQVRGLGLASLLPRLGRAYAFSQWAIDATIVLMSKSNHANGLHKRTGHVNFQEGIEARSSAYGDADFLLFWLTQAEIVREITDGLIFKGNRIPVSNGNAKKHVVGERQD